MQKITLTSQSPEKTKENKVCKKHQHKTELAAQGQALSIMRSKRFSGSPMRVYHCWCGCFHITQMTVDQYKDLNNGHK